MALHDINSEKLNRLTKLVKLSVAHKFIDLAGNEQDAPEGSHIPETLVSNWLDLILKDKQKKYPYEQITLNIPPRLIREVEIKFPRLAHKMATISGKAIQPQQEFNDNHSPNSSVGPSSFGSFDSADVDHHQPIQFKHKDIVKGAFSDTEKKTIQDVLSDHNKSHNADELGDRIQQSPDKINFAIAGVQTLPSDIKETLIKFTRLAETSDQFKSLWAMLAPTEIAGTDKLGAARGGMPSQDPQKAVNYNVTKSPNNIVQVEVTYPGYFRLYSAKQSDKKGTTGNFKINLTFDPHKTRQEFTITRHFTPGKHLDNKPTVKSKDKKSGLH